MIGYMTWDTPDGTPLPGELEALTYTTYKGDKIFVTPYYRTVPELLEMIKKIVTETLASTELPDIRFLLIDAGDVMVGYSCDDDFNDLKFFRVRNPHVQKAMESKPIIMIGNIG